MSVSVVLPAFNEEENLREMVHHVIDRVAPLVDDFEVIVVDDGSADRTGEIAAELAAADPRVRALHHSSNRGYGAALRTGFEAARKDWIFFTDSDRQFDLADLERLLPFRESHDVITGYREERRDPLHRRLYSKGWSGLGRLLFGFPVRDVNCAFKLMRREIVQSLPLMSTGALINTEMYARWVRQGRRFKEVPVRHFPRPAGSQTGGNPAVVLRAFTELFALWVKLRREERGAVRGGGTPGGDRSASS